MCGEMCDDQHIDNGSLSFLFQFRTKTHVIHISNV